MRRFVRIVLKTILWILGSLIALVLLLFVLIRIPAVQQYAVKQVTQYLENKIQTPVRVGYIRLDLPKMLVLENVYFEDQAGDTLLAGEQLKVDFNLMRLFSNVLEIREVNLSGITANINRTLPDGRFNFDYIVEAFTDPNKIDDPADTTAAMTFEVDRIILNRINVSFLDETMGMDLSMQLGDFNTRIQTFDLSGDMHFDIPKIELDGLSGSVKQWVPPTAEPSAPTKEDAGLPPSPGTSRLPELHMRTISLKNIDIAYVDQSGGMDTRFDLGSLLVELEALDLNNQLVALDLLELGPSSSHVIFTKTNPGATKNQTSLPSDESGDSPDQSSGGWNVSANNIRIEDSDFTFRDDNQRRTPQSFDFTNIGIRDFSGELSDFIFNQDTIQGNLEHLQARDHSGFVLRQLRTKFIYTDRGAILDDLIAETDHTLLRDFIQVSYEDLSQLADKIGDLEIDARLQNSHLGMRDVRYFLPDLDTMEIMRQLWPQTIHIDTRIEGPVKDLNIAHLSIQTRDQTRLQASAHIRGLPNMESLWVDLDLDEFRTGQEDINALLPASMLPDSLDLPADISLTGNFTGGFNGFQTQMQLLTSDGEAHVNGEYAVQTLAGGARDTLYDAQLALENLNLGKILKMDSVLGILSLSATVNGRGLDPKTAVAQVDAELQRLDAMGYSYADISMEASADNGQLAAQLDSPDPNIDLQLSAQGDLSGLYPRLRMDLMIDSINLQNLKLMDEDFRYHGRIVADFETADIDHLNGTMHILNSSIAYNEDRFTLDSVRLLAESEENRSLIQFSSEFLNAHLVGDYQLSQLGMAIQDIIAVYYQPEAVAQVYEYEDQQFDFSARLTHSRFVRSILPEITQMQDITLDLSFNSQDKFLLAKALAPNIRYGGIRIDRVGLDITTIDSTMYYSALIEEIGMNNINLINTTVSGTVVQNQLDFGVWIKDSLDTERYHLGVALEVDARQFAMRLLEDGLMLNYESWDVNPGNALYFGPQGLRAEQFVLTQNGQTLMLQSQEPVLNAPLELLFDNFRIETFSQILESEMLNMGGGINGMATLSRLESSPVFVSDLVIEQFYFGRDTIGDILAKVNNERENIFHAEIDIVGNGNHVSLAGDFIALPGQTPTLDFDLALRPMTLKTIEAFSMGYLRNTAGNIEGNLKIGGTTSAPLINGALNFEDAALNVAMLNASFTVDDQQILFDKQGIRFNRFELRDRQNNIARLNGTVLTTTYTDFAFNLSLTADDFQVLNSTRVDNDMYFGQLYISSNMRVTGNLSSPVVDGTLLVNGDTDVTFVLPNEDPGLVDREGIIRFVDRRDTSRVNVFARLDSLTTTELGGLSLSVNIQTEEEAAFSIVIDEGSGDALNIQGAAELTAGIDPSGKITLTGTYTVENGSYSFTFEPVKRVFGFRKGSTIVWSGDPLDARLDITAVYNLRAPTLELVQNQIGNDRTNLYKQRIPFDVILGISGEMLQPQLNFSIDLDEDNALISQDVVSKVNTALAQLQENESEMNKQVFALIVLGRFIAANPFESVSGGANVESMARNSVSSLLSTQLNRLAGDLITGVDLDFDLQSGSDYSTGQELNRTDLNVGVSKMLLDDRLKVTIGSNFELEGNARPGEQTTNIAGDISLDYQLSKDGRYLLRVYRKNQYQVTLQGQFVETGLGFIINLDYDQFREIFMSTKERADLYDFSNRRLNGRFDRDRMETDSAYRDSVRRVVRDSLQRVDPAFRDSVRQRSQETRDLSRAPDERRIPIQRINLFRQEAILNENE